MTDDARIGRVGIVGLGAMGRPIAERIAQAGFDVWGYDLAADAQATGVRRAVDLSDIAASDVAFIMVPLDEDVTKVIAGPVFLTFSKNYHVLGGIGAGQIAKSASNLIHWAEIVAIEEAFQMAAKLGVSPTALRAALVEGGTDSATMRELELMRFTWYAKDIAIAHQMAGEVGLGLPVATLARELMDGISVESVRELLV